MRLLPASVATTVLTSVILVAPTVHVGAAAKPIPPHVTRVAVPSAPATPDGMSRVRGMPVVGALRRLGTSFDVAGVTFASRPPTGLVIEARARVAGTWGEWHTLELEDAAPDPGTPEARRARLGSGPLLEPGADGLEVRVANPSGAAVPGVSAELIEAGSSTSDALTAAPAGSAVAVTARPPIITRSQWGADESLRNCDPTPVAAMKGAVVHHTVNSNSYTQDQAASLMRGIYAYHTTSLGWCDVGYQFLVDRFGRIYEGRVGNIAGNTQGAHAAGVNAETFGVSSIGDHRTTQASSAAQEAMVKVIAWKAASNGFDPGGTSRLTSAGGGKWPDGQVVTLPSTVGHRDVGLTECPGDALYSRVGAIRKAASDLVATANTSWTPMKSTKIEETFVRPTGTVLDLAGRGYGHGRGMSQWGAFGAATKGLTWSQITSFYYPGTSATSQGNPQIRVRVTALGTSSTTVPAQSGLRFSDGTTSLVLPSGTQRWRVVPDGGGVTLQWLTGSGWAASTYWKAWTKSPLTFSRPSTGVLRTFLPNGSQRDYPGSVATTASGGKTLPVNVTTFEQYLRGVVPVEMPASWSPAALQAQSVAARTYAAREKRYTTAATFDTCDTTACQVYRGFADYSSSGVLTSRWTDARTDAAVSANAGMVLLHSGVPALTQFSASNGGRTVYGGQPYLPAKIDPYDGIVQSTSNPHTWTTTVTIAKIEAAYPAVGQLRSLVVTGRSGGGDWSGRTVGVRVVGSAGAVSVTADAFRFATGLKSTWWAVTSTPPRSTATFPRDLTADGLGDAIIPISGGLTALSYTGNMTFLSRTIAAGWSGLRLTTGVGTWDQDNLGDVLAATSDGALWHYPGNASATLAAGRRKILGGVGSINLIIPTGDFNRDGYTDFLTRRTDGTMTLYHGKGRGSITGWNTFGAGWNVFSHILPGDFNGDGQVDLMTVRASDGRMSFYAGTGTGSVQSGVAAGLTDWRFASAVRGVGDLTGDGRHDILVRRASDGALQVYPVTASAVVGLPIAAGTYSATAGWGQ